MNRILIGLIICCICLSAGCVCIKEGIRGVLGVSIKEIENVRDDAIVKVIDESYDNCYDLVKSELIRVTGGIYAEKKDLIAVYITYDDTTPVGVFFKEIDKEKTQIEIASPASDAKEYLAEKVFAVFMKQEEEIINQEGI